MYTSPRLSASPSNVAAARLPEHGWVVDEWLKFEHRNSLVIGGRGIDQEIVLSGCQNRGHEQQAMISSLYKFIPEACEFRRRCRISPICRQAADNYLLAAQVVRNFCNGEYEIGRRVVLIQMDEIFQHR